ncbi:hypothetical protein GUITHDRAFT_145676 [Guillardia theta CCMP2712]|uniref:Uncharacterized protein n=1 Tax=Guillardia theta (strain CCMP2712) TaxID=905079 RepID=L1IKQ7_GUITC|nr:hypothetical protein GUITHDRAFT_145676 [Guillardia theta CCMP2712]EKX36509.1 hypothetical protein GUITHDRAFT_145676 [Guillardia theta CCMP2712]|eukprot:XP_005823489.1 hypothetical protein GUITHDRAFT_145676 [Guillardia theta CCMP2712]
MQEQINNIETTLGTTTDGGTVNDSSLIGRIEGIETTVQDNTQKHEANTTSINNINQVLSAFENFADGNYEQAALDLTNFFTTVDNNSQQIAQHVTDIAGLKASDNQFTLTIQGLADQVTGHQTDISGILDTNASQDQRFTDVAADLLDLQGQIDFINNSTAVLFVGQVLYEILKWKFGAAINDFTKRVWDRINGKYKGEGEYDPVAEGDTYNTFTGDSIQAILDELNDMASVYRYNSLNNAAGINADPISTRCPFWFIQHRHRHIYNNQEPKQLYGFEGS